MSSIRSPLKACKHCRNTDFSSYWEKERLAQGRAKARCSFEDFYRYSIDGVGSVSFREFSRLLQKAGQSSMKSLGKGLRTTERRGVFLS